MEKRSKAEKQKQLKLKNPNYVVSKVRLSIRNLPLEFDEKELKTLCQTHATQKSDEEDKKKKLPKIRQVKIIRSADRTDKHGKARSKRFGFVEFVKHEEALRCLRSLNNNPAIFTKSQRPIVEFSLDDVRKLMVLKKHMVASMKAAAAPAEERDPKEPAEKILSGNRKTRKRKKGVKNVDETEAPQNTDARVTSKRKKRQKK
mmetsp:Transcript_129/g.210  ORF Transcript_129/g.210 Transcript_129/m.210 type:complete len:202 (+) Transcript_129:1062-1667(+)